MSVSTATVAQLYAARNELITALKAVEGKLLVMNPALNAVTDAAGTDAITALAGAGVDAVATGSTVLLAKSGVEFLAPAITGTYVNGYTLTIVDGVVTAIVAG